MEKKKCSKCVVEKELKYYNKNKTGFQTRCRECCKKHYNENKEKIIKRNKEYRDENPDKERARCKRYRSNNVGIERLRSKKYKEAHKEERKIKSAEYYVKNKEKIDESNRLYRNQNKYKTRERNKKYSKENGEKIRATKRVYQKNRRKYVQARLEDALRRRVGAAVRKNNNFAKAGSAIKDIGCSFKSFMEYIEKQFYTRFTGEIMTWDNYGLHGWHIDHIKPLSSFDLTNRQQFLEVCHYTNLQPLWAEDNYAKGSKTP